MTLGEGEKGKRKLQKIRAEPVACAPASGPLGRFTETRDRQERQVPPGGITRNRDSQERRAPPVGITRRSAELVEAPPVERTGTRNRWERQVPPVGITRNRDRQGRQVPPGGITQNSTEPVAAPLGEPIGNSTRVVSFWDEPLRELERAEEGSELDPFAEAFIARDAVGTVPPEWRNPNGPASGKSLMNPQEVANRVLPAELCEKLHWYASEGVPTDCGPNWPKEVKEQAAQAGPHTSALFPENVELIWDDVQYQEKDGFIRIVTEAELEELAPET